MRSGLWDEEAFFDGIRQRNDHAFVICDRADTLLPSNDQQASAADLIKDKVGDPKMPVRVQ